MSNKFQDFKTKLQENKKFQIQFASVVAACVVVLECAITIPVAVHTSNVKKAAENIGEASTSDIAITEEMSEPETTANEATTLADETLTTAAPTSAIADVESKTTPNSNNNSNGGGSRGSSNNKPTTTKPVTTTKKETTTDRYNGELSWTQADVDATVADVKKYAISKGCKIYSDARQTVTINGQVFKTSWQSPLDTRWDYKSRGVSDLEYQVDCAIKYGCNLPFLYGEDGNGVNIFSEKHDGYWEIYVVY